MSFHDFQFINQTSKCDQFIWISLKSIYCFKLTISKNYGYFCSFLCMSSYNCVRIHLFSFQESASQSFATEYCRINLTVTWKRHGVMYEKGFTVGYLLINFHMSRSGSAQKFIMITVRSLMTYLYISHRG